MRVNGKRVPLLLMAVVMVTATVSTAFRFDSVSAAQITNRKLTLLTGAADSNGDGFNDGGSMPGAVVNHQFDFTVPTGGNVGSIQFQYCTTASGTCTLPTGLVTTSATIGAEDNNVSGFTMVNTSNGAPYVTRTAANVSAAEAISYRLNSITNPDDPGNPNYTFFVRISTFSSTNATTGVIDTGTVAATTSEQIVLTGTMPESLIFCTGAAITTTNSIPDCTTATSGAITFNQLFSPTDTASATSQMAASTNALNGYAITINGPTLTSGSYTIPALAALDTSKKGFGQFGLNLRANTVAAAEDSVGNPIGIDVTPTSNAGLSLRAQPTTDYNTIDSFKFGSGDTVAKSDFGGSDGPTNSQIYTSTYIVNVTGAQVAGTYTTTLTYVCTPTF